MSQLLEKVQDVTENREQKNDSDTSELSDNSDAENIPYNTQSFNLNKNDKIETHETTDIIFLNQ